MLRVIGDVHCKLDNYIKLCKKAESQKLATLQVGDLCLAPQGYDYIDAKLGSCNLDGNHFFFAGNHDYYPRLPQRSLGKFGLVKINEISFFFIRGAFSIDKKYRKPGINWFPEEELTREELEFALKLYVESRADIVITHDAPRNVGKIIGNPNILRTFGFSPDTFNTKTSEYLQECFKVYKPKVWIHGHFHIDYSKVIDGTTFIGLPELGYLDIKEDEIFNSIGEKIVEVKS